MALIDDQVLPAHAQEQIRLLHDRLVVAEQHLELVRLLPLGLVRVRARVRDRVGVRAWARVRVRVRVRARVRVRVTGCAASLRMPLATAAPSP